MALYRKTTPSSYPNTPASNFTDSSKNWRKHANMYRKTSGNETASLIAVPGRYTDDTRTWRRIKALYRRTSSGTWQKIFGKFSGQPYAETSAKIRYDSYTGTDVVDFAMMGPGANGIAQGSAGTTYLWGRDGADWQNIENLTSRSRTFVFGSTPIPETSEQVINDEGFNEGDKLRNTEAVILQYDGKYLWYRDRISVSSTSGASTGTSYSQTVRVIKQRPFINSLAFKTDTTVTPGELKYVSVSLANEWYRSANQTTSSFKWYILDSQYETPTEAKLYGTTNFSSVVLTETATALTMEDYFTIPTTFNGSSTIGKWLHVKLICKNSSSDTDVNYKTAPYNDVTDQVIAQIAVGIPSFTYTISNVSSVTTPSAPTQTRVSSTSNDILFEFASSIPSDTLNYTLNLSGPVTNAGNNSLNVLNIFSNNSDYQTTLTSAASNSAVSSYVVANGNTRSYQANVSATTGAQSWKVNYTYTIGVLSETDDVLTNVMPVKIIDIPGSTNPIVRINSVTAYSGLNQTGTAKTGTAGATTSLNISRPTATSSTSTSNYTYYQNLQVTGSQRRVTLPAVFNSGTTIYVSTNGYINWGGSSLPESDRGISISIPALDNSGITIAPLNGDLRQGSTVSSSNTSPGGLWYFADATNFWVTWWGNYYSDALQYARYQVKFYWGSNVADIYIVNNSLTSITPSTTAVQNNLNQFQNWSTTTSQISTLLSTASMNRVSTKDGFDDDRTVLVASPPVLTWTVTWDAAGGEGGTQFTTQNRGVAHTAPSPGVRDGFNFVNYRYPPTGPDPTFVASGGTYNPTGSVTFAAVWAAKTYSVSYNANLGTGAPSGQTKTHGVALTLSSTSPTRAPVGNTSYSFSGWNTASDGTGTNYSAGGSYTTNAAVILYAKWTATTATTYYLTYFANSGSTTPTGQQGIQGASVTLAANAGTRSGFTFGGWNIGGTTYSGGGSYTFGAADANATAIWTSTFVAPSSPAPSMQFSRKTTATTHLQWYCDYPSISGDGTITSMQYEIRTTAGGGTLLASGTRSYPGSGTYPYSAGGTIWGFRMGTTDGDISYSSSARYGRARVVMLGTNGTTYYGTWSAWL